MASLWAEKSGGRDAMMADMDEGQESYLGECAEYVRPTVCEYFRTPEDVFDDHIYPKGAWILYMLQRRVGNDAWWKGINKYLSKYRASVVATDDFRKCIEEASGTDLKPFFDQWVTGVGHPEFKVTQSWDEAAKKLTLIVQQIQPVGPVKFQDLETVRPVFQVSVDVEFQLPGGKRRPSRSGARADVADLRRAEDRPVDPTRPC
jgi:aminopeptidase N